VRGTGVNFQHVFWLYYSKMVEWSWYDSSLIWKTNWFPSVLWHCWCGHVTCKNRPGMTNIVLSGTSSLRTTTTTFSCSREIGINRKQLTIDAGHLDTKTCLNARLSVTLTSRVPASCTTPADPTARGVGSTRLADAMGRRCRVGTCRTALTVVT